MEVVLANGDLVRTGMGAMPAAKTWQQFKTGYGPSFDGMFSQSNFGIVTKMGFWLMPEPEAYLSGFVHVFKHDDLIPLVDIVTHLENCQIVTGMPYFGSPIWSHGMRVTDLIGGTPPDKELLDLLAKPGGPVARRARRVCRQGRPRPLGCVAAVLRTAQGHPGAMGVR